jgi:hypothetical protein
MASWSAWPALRCLPCAAIMMWPALHCCPDVACPAQLSWCVRTRSACVLGAVAGCKLGLCVCWSADALCQDSSTHWCSHLTLCRGAVLTCALQFGSTDAALLAACS